MGSKRTSAAAPNMEFLRSEHAGKEDKCKEFWKYLDEKRALQPYRPPKFTEDAKQGTSSITDVRSAAGPSTKAPTYPCHTGTKPKKSAKKETKAKKSYGKYSQYEKSFREDFKFAEYKQSAEELLAEIDEYDRRLNAMYPVKCPICENVECACSDE